MQKVLFEYLATIVDLQQQLLVVLSAHTETANGEEWLDNADVKQLLKISDRTLHRLRSTQTLRCQKIGGKWYYPRKALEQYFAVK